MTAPAPVAHHDQQRPASGTPIQGREPSTSPTTDSEHLTGDPRALLALRLLAAAALLVTALIHARLAFQLGLGGAPLGRGQLFFIQAVFSAVIATAMFTRNNRVWLLAVVFSAAGLIAILASVYFPIAAVGPFPAIDEPTWLLTKASLRPGRADRHRLVGDPAYRPVKPPGVSAPLLRIERSPCWPGGSLVFRLGALPRASPGLEPPLRSSPLARPIRWPCLVCL